MKRLIFSLLVTLTCLAQTSSMYSIPDITGTGATVALTPGVHTLARWVDVSALSTNASLVRFGDATVNVNQGTPIYPGGNNHLQPGGPQYDLSQIYVFIASGDKVAVTWQNY